MRLSGAIAGELIRAFAVLALVFLSFVQPPLAIDRYGVSPAVSAAVEDGAYLPGDRADPHLKLTKACDGCRLAVDIALPVPPAPVRLALAVRPAAPLPRFRQDIGRPPVLAGGGPRAPPVAARA